MYRQMLSPGLLDLGGVAHWIRAGDRGWSPWNVGGVDDDVSLGSGGVVDGLRDAVAVDVRVAAGDDAVLVHLLAGALRGVVLDVVVAGGVLRDLHVAVLRGPAEGHCAKG